MEEMWVRRWEMSENVGVLGQRLQVNSIVISGFTALGMLAMTARDNGEHCFNQVGSSVGRCCSLLEGHLKSNRSAN